MRLRADTCELPGGRTISPYYVIEEFEWVHVVAVKDTGDVLTVRQYRHAASTVCMELPGGMVDVGEEPLAAARRELHEETGHIATSWDKIGCFWANPARQNNRVHVFLASGLTKSGAQSLDESEEIAWAFVTQQEVIEQIRAGAFSQALHIASFYAARERLADLKG